MNPTVLVIIATGNYIDYVNPLVSSAKKFFVSHDIFLFSDSEHIFSGVDTQVKCEYLGYPGQTLMRYHSILSQQTVLRDYDNLFYVDVDMLFVAPIKEDDIFADGVVATLHPGYVNRSGTPERRASSTAYIPPDAKNSYFCGGFIGGKTDSFLYMAEEIKKNVDIDTEKGITAIWHDESHSNNFLWRNPPARVLTPSYCWPEGCGGTYCDWPESYPAKLVALTKGPR